MGLLYLFFFKLNFTLQLSGHQPEYGPTNRAETCRWNYNLIKFHKTQSCVCITYILYYILAYIQHKGDVSLQQNK